MLDNKHIEEIKRNYERAVKEGKIIESSPKYTDFFLKNSINSLTTARVLFALSTREDTRKKIGLASFDSFLWVINSAYYSMFYLARALLENKGINLKTDLSIHSVTFNAFVYHFYLTGKIERSLVEEFQEAEKEASEILGREKARELVEDFSREKDKRGRFTYETGEIAMRNKAQTSLDRAKKFNEEMRKILGR
ncbi:MAG: hypothetical protein KKE50_00520 [Nanoarchaeota archaeon]|nr:hypothetical protein [Nanoarchaeota archaeon]